MSNTSVELFTGYTDFFSFVTGFQPAANVVSTSLVGNGVSGYLHYINFADGSYLEVALNEGGTIPPVSPPTFDNLEFYSFGTIAGGHRVLDNLAVGNPGNISIRIFDSDDQLVANLGSNDNWTTSLLGPNFVQTWLQDNNTIRPSNDNNVTVTDDQNLFGYAGSDIIIGGSGNDTITAGAGDNALVGGDLGPSNAETFTGNDTFVLGANVVSGLTIYGTDSTFVTALKPGEINTLKATGNNDFTNFCDVFWINRIEYAGATTLSFAAGNFNGNNRIQSDTTIVGSAGLNVLNVLMNPASGFFASGDLDLSDLVFQSWSSADKVTITAHQTGGGTSTVFGPNVATTFNGGARADTFTGGSANDTIFGGIQNDVLNGRGGNDFIDGGTDADTMSGGTGNDTYIVDNVGDTAVEAANGGTDTVRSSVSFSLAGQSIERLELTGSANINGTGNALDNLLTGNAGNNTLDGGTGADEMRGLAGNDIYIVDNAGDEVFETANQGTDTVKVSVSFSLVGQNIERLELTGSANINGTGNSLDNRLTGNSGNNVLDGKTGADRMTGLGGDDTYHVDDAGDVVIESANGGTDTVRSSVDFNLTGQHIERLVLTGSADIDGSGNSLANLITGNAGENTLNGGTGKDVLTGGGGIDFFRFNAALSASNADTITDLQVNVDKIQLENAIFTAVGASLTAVEFVANAAGTATNASQHILYDTTDGRLFYDADGNGALARVHFATLTAGLALDHLDFVVI